jgi:beta-galactosidase
MLERNISFNLYMVHGGTSFGPMAGANFDKVYQPDISSYDYDSPIDEAGRPAPKFALYRDTIKKHLLPGEQIPDLPAPLPIIEIPTFEFQPAVAPLLPVMPVVAKHDTPQTFETLGLDYGFVLYRTRIENALRGTLKIEGLHDYAVVMEGSRIAGRLDRRLNQDSLEIALQPGATLQILVENMGRINFGPKLMEDRKGILGQVTLDGKPLTGWEMCTFRIDKLPRLNYNSSAQGPAFHRATFQVPKLGDTYIDLRGWGKGYAWVNSFCLGRYWKIGPQQTLFCPRPFLKRGVNELVILDLEDSPKRNSRGLKDPVWETISA